jgi:hypothetical protein
LAYTAVIADEAKDGMYYTLGIAEEDVAGYSPVKETGDPSDPFFVAKFPTRFNTIKEADEQAKKLNREMLHISDTEALLIVTSSMRAQNMNRGRV